MRVTDCMTTRTVERERERKTRLTQMVADTTPQRDTHGMLQKRRRGNYTHTCPAPFRLGVRLKLQTWRRRQAANPPPESRTWRGKHATQHRDLSCSWRRRNASISKHTRAPFPFTKQRGTTQRKNRAIKGQNLTIAATGRHSTEVELGPAEEPFRNDACNLSGHPQNQGENKDEQQRDRADHLSRASPALHYLLLLCAEGQRDYLKSRPETADLN